jgi:hypothetical protein
MHLADKVLEGWHAPSLLQAAHSCCWIMSGLNWKRQKCEDTLKFQNFAN